MPNDANPKNIFGGSYKKETSNIVSPKNAASFSAKHPQEAPKYKAPKK